VDQVSVNATAIAWQSSTGGSAGVVQGNSFTRITTGNSVALFNASLPVAAFGTTNVLFSSNLPGGILTSQGLV
jgi:hypothetical protein